MKCKNCGGDLTIENKYCSFCGTENEAFVQHRKDMEVYQGEFVKTQKEVYDNTKKVTGLFLKITVIAILIACNLLIAAMTSGAYEVSYFIDDWNLRLHENEYKEKITQLELDEKYYELAVFYNEKNLYASNKLREFTGVYNAASSYVDIYNSIIRLSIGDMDDYDTPTYHVENIANNFKRLYEVLDEDSWYFKEWMTEEHKTSIENICELSESLLITYLQMPEKEARDFKNLSEANRLMLLETYGLE